MTLHAWHMCALTSTTSAPSSAAPFQATLLQAVLVRPAIRPRWGASWQ
jgi:hypothetical protein